MNSRITFCITLAAALFLVAACAGKGAKTQVSTTSVEPGSSVTFKGKKIELLGDPIAVGEPLPPVKLVEAMNMQDVDLSESTGRVLFLSLVPSLDTRVCEAQTHALAEEGDRMPDSVRRITISRDTPFAQQRFAEEAGLSDIEYLSDYRQGDFGRATGLLTEELMLLARAVLIVDASGLIRYIQVVPEMATLPDMDRAFSRASALAER